MRWLPNHSERWRGEARAQRSAAVSRLHRMQSVAPGKARKRPLEIPPPQRSQVSSRPSFARSRACSIARSRREASSASSLGERSPPPRSGPAPRDRGGSRGGLRCSPARDARSARAAARGGPALARDRDEIRGLRRGGRALRRSDQSTVDERMEQIRLAEDAVETSGLVDDRQAADTRVRDQRRRPPRAVCRCGS